MKILVINPMNTRETGESGGKVVNRRNVEVLCKCFGKEQVTIYNVCYYHIKSAALFHSLNGYCGGLTKRIVADIRRELVKNKYNCIFLNSAWFGMLAGELQNVVRVITFFHNVDSMFYRLQFNSLNTVNRLLRYPVFKAIVNAERNAVTHSSMLITLNNRDSTALEKLYGRKADLIFPISFYDQYDEKTARVHNAQVGRNTLLFVGSDFFGNTEGLFWFIENCMGRINADLLIVGNGMEKYADKYYAANIRFVGYVDNIAEYYYKVDAVVLPILSGSGMKTKTCEALMYGKTIFGTQEAFEGYDALNLAEHDWLCKTAEDFIAKTNRFLNTEHNKHNEYSRNIYLKHYDSRNLEAVLYRVIGGIGKAQER